MTYEVVLEALADPTRRAILELLREGPHTVNELAAEMPVSRPAVSQHLAVLRTANLVDMDRQGTSRVYYAQPEGLDELRKYIERFWGDVLLRFQASARAKAKGKKK